MKRLLELLIAALTLASLASASSQSLIERTVTFGGLPAQFMNGPAALAMVGGAFVALAILVRKRCLSGKDDPTGGAI